jgi:hypothetical protein
MLEYLWFDNLRSLARHYPTQLQLLSGVADPEHYYTIAAIGEHLVEREHPFNPPVSGKHLRIEIDPFPVRPNHWVFPGDAVEFHGTIGWQRVESMLQTLALSSCWLDVFSHFSVRYGTYTLYAHCV